MSTTLYETTVTYINGTTETIHHGWDKVHEGLLHLYDVEQTSDSRTIVLANVLRYDQKRHR